ncbi:MAG TPA: DUF6524 family protein [Paracoccaceae bacterium]|nr:DUF6524 family protein [Paracoccaceae bacterium]
MTGILLRWAIAFALVTATYNPTSWNYLVWANNGMSGGLPFVVLCGIILLIAYVIYLRATFRSIGLIGIGLVSALIGAIIWVLVDLGWLSLSNPAAMTWVGLIAVSLVMGIGLSWSHVRRSLSGQADMDDVDE